MEWRKVNGLWAFWRAGAALLGFAQRRKDTKKWRLSRSGLPLRRGNGARRRLIRDLTARTFFFAPLRETSQKPASPIQR
jgi:hypothetical protein